MEQLVRRKGKGKRGNHIIVSEHFFLKKENICTITQEKSVSHVDWIGR